jgi:uncharacterized protein DUF4251|tara:strand:+ start:12478 stop:12960 length:483 start_codon:yes stop_codon:yes gene_type:complete
MKALRILYTLVVLFIFGSTTAQNKTEKPHTSIETLLNSKNFEFIANTALPLGQPPKNLVGSNYSITFSPEMVISNMPFYGRSYSDMALGRDKGMRFKGMPEIFTVKNENKGYVAETRVENENDIYTLLLTVSESGFATLTLKTNDRQTTTYEGEVVSIRE